MKRDQFSSINTLHSASDAGWCRGLFIQGVVSSMLVFHFQGLPFLCSELPEFCWGNDYADNGQPLIFSWGFEIGLQNVAHQTQDDPVSVSLVARLFLCSTVLDGKIKLHGRRSWQAPRFSLISRRGVFFTPHAVGTAGYLFFVQGTLSLFQNAGTMAQGVWIEISRFGICCVSPSPRGD